MSPQSNSCLVRGAADDSAEPKGWQCSAARLHCELNKQTSEQPADGSPSAPPSLSPQHKSRLRSDGEEIPASETAHELIPTSESDGEGHVPTDSRPPFEPTAAERQSADSVTHSVPVAAATSVGSLGSALHHHVAGSGASPASPEPPADCPGVAEASRNTALQTGSALEASPVPSPVPHEIPSAGPPNGSRLELQSERDAGANLMLCAVCLSGIVSLSVVVQQPSALFFIGLLLVMRRL